MVPKEFYRLSEFDSLPEEHGFYAWYLVHNELGAEAEDYYRFFKTKEFRIQLSSNLQDRYRIQAKGFENLNFRVYENDILEYITINFSPPIYIGIAENQTLRKRLSQHKKKLQFYLNGGTINSEDFGSFSARVKQKIDAHNLKLNENNFIVKVVPVDTKLKNKIKDIEHLVNRTFHPLCGER